MGRKRGPNSKQMSSEDKDVLRHYGKLIHEYRMQSSIPRYELCERIDITNSQLSKWEAGTAEPRLHSMLRLCDLLHIPLEKLLYNTDKEDITAEETKLVSKVRKIPSPAKEYVMGLIEQLSKQMNISVPLEQTIGDADLVPEEASFATVSSFGTAVEEQEIPIFTEEDVEGTLLQPEIPEADTESKRSKAIANNASTKKRGRPRKERIPTDPPKKRGRPRKITADQTVITNIPIQERESVLGDVNIEGTAKKRGRPRKEKIPTDPPKKRGRPRKITADQTVITDGSQEALNGSAGGSVTYTPKKRGRPPKNK